MVRVKSGRTVLDSLALDPQDVEERKANLQ